MTGGFDAVPDELRQTAGTIGDAISGVADLVWRGPGGDYGHAGVQQGWAQFIEDMRGSVQKLHATAEEHGENLKKAAVAYVGSDADVGAKLGQLGDLVHDLGAPMGGGLGGIVPSVAAGSDDGGMVGGGWAGPLKDRGVDLGADADAHSGIMSPERSHELFPQGSIERRLDPGPDEDGPVY
ncbi:MAG TPA: hypothetical protein VJ870_08845 [Amycolatopsis sp.]|nr:hypothetical protein [Amycolatopsis sp.]